MDKGRWVYISRLFNLLRSRTVRNSYISIVSCLIMTFMLRSQELIQANGYLTGRNFQLTRYSGHVEACRKAVVVSVLRNVPGIVFLQHVLRRSEMSRWQVFIAVYLLL